jgi:hypothetical protein
MQNSKPNDGSVLMPQTTPRSVKMKTVIEFAKGTSTLSMNDETRLRELVMNSKIQGFDYKIEVAVWSDKAHPKKGNLSKADIKLADLRATQIKNAIEMDQGNTRNVSVFNMADGAHWLARTFNTNDAELDSAFAKRGTSQIKRDDFRIIKAEGGPMKAVVLVTVKE